MPNVSTFCILAERGRPGRSSQENCYGLNGLIGNFPTLHDSRRDNEMCWLLDVRSLTNPPDLVISSPKTKGSVIPQAEWSWSEDSANVSQGRTNVNIQSTPVEWAVRKGGGTHLPCKAKQITLWGSSPEFQHVLYVQSISVFLFSITFHLIILPLSW